MRANEFKAKLNAAMMDESYVSVLMEAGGGWMKSNGVIDNILSNGNELELEFDNNGSCVFQIPEDINIEDGQYVLNSNGYIYYVEIF